MAAAVAMPPPPTTITDLPLLPLARIARGLKCAEIIKLCDTYPELAAHRDTLLQHALPSELSRSPMITDGRKPDHTRVFLSSDGAHVARVFRVGPSAAGTAEAHNHHIYAGRVGGELRPAAVSRKTYVSEAGFTDGPDVRLIVWSYTGVLHVMTADGSKLLSSTHTLTLDDTDNMPLQLRGACCVLSDASGEFVFRCNDRQVDLEMPPGETITSLHSVAVSRDWRLCAANASNYMKYVWDTHTGALLHTIGGAWMINGDENSIAFSDDGTRIVFCTVGGSYRVWDLSAGKPCAHIHPGHVQWATRAAVSGSVALVARSEGMYKYVRTEVIVIDLVFGEHRTVVPRENKVAKQLALSPDCTRAVVVYDDDSASTLHLGDLAARLRRRGRRRALAAATAE